MKKAKQRKREKENRKRTNMERNGNLMGLWRKDNNRPKRVRPVCIVKTLSPEQATARGWGTDKPMARVEPPKQPEKKVSGRLAFAVMVGIAAAWNSE